jgi:hypothetical protein
MTKELFTQNVKSSTFSMYIKVLLVVLLFSIVLDPLMFSILSDEESKIFFGSFDNLPLPALTIFGVILCNIVFLVCLRGFVGHLKPSLAFKKVLIFFLLLGVFFNSIGVMIHEMTLLLAVITTISTALSNALIAYFLGKSSYSRS